MLVVSQVMVYVLLCDGDVPGGGDVPDDGDILYDGSADSNECL